MRAARDVEKPRAMAQLSVDLSAAFGAGCSDFALCESIFCGAARLYAFVIDDIKNDSVPCDEVTLSCRKQPILGER